MECIFSSESGPEIETVSDTYEFLGKPLSIWDGIMTMPWYIVSEEGRLLHNGFIMESVNSFGYSLNI
jgi:hypothetical protein